MKVIVAGSRSINDIVEVSRALHAAGLNSTSVKEIVSGGAQGVDSLGEKIARDYHINMTRFNACWDMYGKSAGYKRNEEMADYADMLVAIWDGKSKGTKHMINIMREKKKKIYIHLVEENK